MSKMDITSLLQGSPSIDRTRRKPQSWEENAASSKVMSTSVEEQLPSMSSLSASVTNEYNTPGAIANNNGHQQQQQRSYQAISEYPSSSNIHQTHGPPQSQSQSQPHSSSSSYYYQKHIEREKERVELPLNPPRDYVDVETPEGLIRMKKQDYLKQSQLPTRPVSSSQPIIHSPIPVVPQISLSDIIPPIPISRAPTRPVAEEITAQVVPVGPLPPPPRTPSPVLDAAHLGLYIYPSLPFPIRPSVLPYNRRTTLTILVPSSLLPYHHTSRTTTAGIYADSRARRIWGGVPHTDQRKIYTDDSDVVFAALHSETIPDDPTLFSSGKDLQLTLRLYPAPESGHFVGGKGAAGLTSASWGNAHEGCAYTIQEAVWVAQSTSRSYTRQTRKARMAEYAQRRATIMSSQSLSFLINPSLSTGQPGFPKSSDPLPLKPEMHPIEDEMASLSVVGGWRAAVGFKYSPMTLYLMLFAFSSSASHMPKRRKLDHPPCSREVALAESSKDSERIVLVPKPPLPQSEQGTAMEVDDASGGPSFNGADPSLTDAFMRYDLYREVRTSSPTPAEPGVEVLGEANQNTKPKGVRFTEEAINKDEARESESWSRTLLHSNLGPQDILFMPEFILVGEDKYTVDTWRWKSDARDDERIAAGKIAQSARSKKRGLKKRKTKSRKAKFEGASAESESMKVQGDSKNEETKTEDATWKLESVDAASTAGPDKASSAKGAVPSASVVDVPRPPVLAPVAPKEEREEGELSDETPAAA